MMFTAKQNTPWCSPGAHRVHLQGKVAPGQITPCAQITRCVQITPCIQIKPLGVLVHQRPPRLARLAWRITGCDISLGYCHGDRYHNVKHSCHDDELRTTEHGREELAMSLPCLCQKHGGPHQTSTTHTALCHPQLLHASLVQCCHRRSCDSASQIGNTKNQMHLNTPLSIAQDIAKPSCGPKERKPGGIR